MKTMIRAAAFLTLAVGAPALAAGDAGKARSLIVERCTPCHAVPGYRRPKGVAEVGAPPFLAVARAPGTYTEARLRAFLRRPHWPMTKFILSESDIDNVLAYIESLRRK